MVWHNAGNLLIVAAAYLGLFFALPYFLLGFSGRNRLEKFWVGGLLSHLYVIFCVYLLGFIGIYNAVTLWVMIALMAGFLFYKFRWQRFVARFNRATQTTSRRLDGLYSGKLLRQQRRMQRRAKIIARLKRIRPGNVLGVLCLIFCLALVIYYRTYYMTQTVGFSTADLYVHLEWIKHLNVEQVVFYNGVYPYGMQNICSSIGILFSIDAYTVLHCFGPINGTLVALSFYFILSRIFTSKVAVYVAMLAYAASPVLSNSGFGRLSHALPQDCSLWPACLSGYFLWKFLRSRRRIYLIMWGCCALMALLYHPFSAVMAVAVSLVVLLCMISRVRRRRLRDTGIALAIVAALGFAPLLFGRAIGIEWEHSMRWGVRIISALPWVDAPEPEPDEPNTSLLPDDFVPPELPDNPTLWDRLEYAAGPLFLNNGHMLTVVCLLVSLLCALILLCVRRCRPRAFLMLALVVLLWAIYLIVVVSGSGQDYEVIIAQRDRVAALFMALICLVYGVPIEFLSALIGRRRILSIAYAVASSTVFIWLTYQIMILGHARPKILIPQSQYNGVVEAYYRIIDEYPDRNWTMVSPVEEYTMVMGKGYHYELYRFFDEMQEFDDDTRVELPTPYVFIVTEKRPLEHYRTLDLNGPYIYMPSVDLSKAAGTLQIEEGEELREYYTNYDKRMMLEAKAHIWANLYAQSYPKEMTVYYEDEEVAIYRVEQHAYALNNFAIDYGYN